MEESKEEQEKNNEIYNISLSYVQKLIMQNYEELQEYMTIAIFGASRIDTDVFMNNENLRAFSRLKGLRRAIYTLINIIRAGKFILKNNDRKIFTTYTGRLLKIEKNLYKLRIEKKRGMKVIELSIDESLFDKMYEELNNIIDSVNQFLNSVGIIFAVKDEETDPDKIKETFKKKYRGE